VLFISGIEVARSTRDTKSACTVQVQDTPVAQSEIAQRRWTATALDI